MNPRLRKKDKRKNLFVFLRIGIKELKRTCDQARAKENK